jgi:hypothetical protein
VARSKRRARSTSEKIMLIVGLLVAVSMVLGGIIGMM